MAFSTEGGRWRRVARWVREPRNLRGILIPGAVIVALFILGRTVDVHTYIASARDWLAQFGPWAGVAYGSIFVVATLLFMPGTPFTVLAALLFGVRNGFIIMVVATTASASIAFFITRYFAKQAFEKRLGRTKNFVRLRRLVERNRWFAIPAVRFLPMFPFSFNNYALGLTNISFPSYLLWSEVVFVPMNAVLVLGASAIYRALLLGEVSWGLLGGATAAGLAVLLLGFLAKRQFGDLGKDE